MGAGRAERTREPNPRSSGAGAGPSAWRENACCLSTHDEAQVAWPQPAQTRNRGKAKRSRFLINTRRRAEGDGKAHAPVRAAAGEVPGAAPNHERRA